MAEELQQAGLTWRVTPDLMCVLDRDGRFIAVNPAWYASLGWTREEMVGHSYLEFLHPEDVERSIAAFEVVKSGEPVLRFENRYRTRDGKDCWLSWVAVPEGDHFFCTVRDVTEVKLQTETISAQRNEADLREQFLAVLGHDLRNPLAAFKAGISIMSRRIDKDAAGDVILHMNRSADRMSELIDNMMDFARVRLGDGIGLNLKTVEDIFAEIEQIVEELRAVAPDLRFEVTSEGEGRVNCDPARIKQLLANLLGNAVTHGRPTDPIKVSSSVADGRFRVAISNSGDPIPPEAWDKLFQPFFRGEVRSSQQGLGLGLYISSEIVKAHGGTLDVMSEDDDTCFVFEIPA